MATTGGDQAAVSRCTSEPDDGSTTARTVVGRNLGATALVIGALAIVYAVYGIWLNPLRPHVQTPNGYYGWVDQSFYLRSARVLAHPRLPVRPVEYFYGLGYPLLGALFIKLGFHGDPFAPADALLFGGICSMFFVLAVRLWHTVFGAVRPIIGLLAIAVLVFGTPLFQFIITPYNSTLVIFSFLLILVLVTSARAMTWTRAVAVGLLLGWIFATRYADVLFVGLPVVAALLVRPRAERFRLALGGMLGLLAVVALVGYTQYHAFGNPFITPYHFHTRLAPGLGNDQSLKNYRIGWIPSHFVGEVITGRLNGVRVDRDPMLYEFPLLPFVSVGAVALIRRTGPMRPIWIAATVASVASSLFYFSFIAGGPGDLVFNNLRYWALWYPLWSILALIGANITLQFILNRRRGHGPPQEFATESTALTKASTVAAG